MIKSLLIFCAAAAVFTLSSCESCVTCTSMSSDPSFDESVLLEEELCGRGKVHDDAVERFEQAGWNCEEE